MSIRRAIKSWIGRKAKATRNGTPGSHVNHKANKRIGSKSARRFERDDYGFPRFQDITEGDDWVPTDEEPH